VNGALVIGAVIILAIAAGLIFGVKYLVPKEEEYKW
jgi:hypothetical protein